jgi:hypothetical protein
MATVCDCHIVDGFNMLRFAQMLDCCDESFRARVEEVFRDRSVVLFAPYFRLFVFLRCVSRRFTEADEPWKRVSK